MPAPLDKAKLDEQRGQHLRKCVSDISTCLSHMLREFIRLFWLRVLIYKRVLKGV